MSGKQIDVLTEAMDKSEQWLQRTRNGSMAVTEALAAAAEAAAAASGEGEGGSGIMEIKEDSGVSRISDNSILSFLFPLGGIDAVVASISKALPLLQPSKDIESAGTCFFI